MSSVMVAVFSSFGDAESVRTELIRDGFPPARVELTATSVVADLGPQPRDSSRRRYERYFSTFFSDTNDRGFVEELARRVASGRITTVAVHPRGALEASRATEILENQGALQVVPDELAAMNDLNSSETGSWLDYLIPEYAGAAGRFCLRPLSNDGAERVRVR